MVDSPALRPSGCRWHPATRVAFRFLFVYFLLSSWTALVQLIPLVGGFVPSAIDAWTYPGFVWIGRAVFGVEITVFPNGSGDTTFNWVQVATHVVFALVAAAAWTALDRKSVAYPRLKDGLWIAMRFVLASAMLVYGFDKVFLLQFPSPTMQRLMQPYGESSPMGLLWTFIGASEPYQFFAGTMEVVGGMLLLFRITQLAGALWCAGVMANVVLLNFCYDVPVKIYSSHLLMMALVIAAPDLPRLVRMFVLNRGAEPVDLAGPWTSMRWRRVARVVKWSWIALTVPLLVWQTYGARAIYGPDAPKGALDGTWEVVEFRRDGVDVPPLITDAARWRYCTLFDRPEFKTAEVTRMQDASERWFLVLLDESGARVQSSSTNGKLELHERGVAAGDDPAKAKVVATLDYALQDDGRMRVAGEFAGARIEALCARKQAGDYLLVNRGFHWINETPFNR